MRIHLLYFLSVCPKKLAANLLALSKTKTLGQKLNILKSLSFKDLMPVPPAVAEYSTGLSMGQTAEQMAKTHGISRAEQDALAHRSHTLASQAWKEGKIQGEVMTAFPEPYKKWISEDNNVRHDSTLEAMQSYVLHLTASTAVLLQQTVRR